MNGYTVYSFMKLYIIERKNGEYLTDFHTKIANEIRAMDVSIKKCLITDNNAYIWYEE